MCRTMLGHGFLKATEGNVSVRIPGRQLYAVTPSNYGYEKMRPEDVCVLDFGGKPVPVEGASTLAPSVEAAMHATIYRERPDVNAIVHTHQPFASALAYLRTPIPALSDEQSRFLGGEVPIVDYAPAGTSFLAANMRKKLRTGGNAYILANHGVVVLGSDPERAVFAMGLLEKVSIAYLMALVTEPDKVYTVPAPIREIAINKLRSEQKRIGERVTNAVPAEEIPETPLPSADALAAQIAAARTTDPETPGVRTDGAGAGGAVERGGAAEQGSWPSAASLGYGISTYPDVAEVYRRLEALIDQPVRGPRHDAMLGVLDYFETRCASSKEITTRAKKRLPGGVQHNLAFNYPFPLAISRADGAHLTDVDGNTYIDFLQAGGPTILGSNYAPVRERVHEVIRESGPVTGLFHAYELELAELIHHYLPSIEVYRSLGSGTEGVMAAVRGARAFTGKPMVIKMGGAYHGWSDTMVVGLRVPGTWRMNAKGIPLGATADTREAFPESLGELKRKLIENKVRGGTAAVIVEPVGPESGTRPVPEDYNAKIRELCDEFNALLIFDEVVTGFRLGMGGAQGYFGVRPDLTVLGKAVSGGYPMAGGVGGREDVMAVFGSGLDGKNGAHVQVGGTLSANPLSCAAGVFAIEEMARTNAPVIAGRAGDRLAEGLKRLIAKWGLPYVVHNTGAIVHLASTGVMMLSMRHPAKLLKENGPRKEAMEHMGAVYASHGIITLAGSRLYTSMACTDAVIDDALDRFDRSFALVEGV
ncbi:aminotransferase class III-fold pyridoxal phosphate-dependent enzyme [Propionicimonas sp.]|uniref:aminotransferase class III-fold pyridoxal phosphate-dependent enzyme n=1 Tax=Propionicimonas sp. TaxID=1955623 RepID=UPI0039E65EF2